MYLGEESDLSLIRGIGQKKLEALNGMGIYTVYDLLMFLPAAYKDRGELTPFAECCPDGRYLLEAVYTGVGTVGGRGKFSRSVLKFAAGDDVFDVCFYNQPYIRKTLKCGYAYRLFGTFKANGEKKALIAPQIERCEIQTYLNEGIYPVYPLSVKSGLKQKELYKYIRIALEQTELSEKMPLWIIADLGLKGFRESLRLVHSPGSAAEAYSGLRYFKALNFIAFFAAVNRRAGRRRASGLRLDVGGLDKYLAALPFKLTPSQAKAVAEIADDMASGYKMNRLLQGDVGSGKTAVAAAAAYLAAAAGYQCAFTAPTEILARQHYEKYAALLAGLGINSTVVFASMKKKDREAADRGIREGKYGVVFGTHALFSRQTEYKNLALIIIDEQHRYGVSQRAELENKGVNPHVLVMSATPIPRTLSLSLYKDLSLSVLAAKPSGRIPVKTILIDSAQNSNAYGAVRRSAAQGLKTYIVCPAIDAEDLESVKTVFEEAEKELAPLKVLYLTGEMKENEKQETMRAFSEGNAQVLVATTVIEVGVDVKKAAIMWVKSAERFGLAQLHQLRGRVGRNDRQCYCFLQCDRADEKTLARLTVLKNSDDGFEIARQDLKLRGAGDIYGIRQSGRSDGILEDAVEYADLFMACDLIGDKLRASDKPKDRAFYGEMLQRGEKNIGDVALN